MLNLSCRTWIERCYSSHSGNYIVTSGDMHVPSKNGFKYSCAGAKWGTKLSWHDYRCTNRANGKDVMTFLTLNGDRKLNKLKAWTAVFNSWKNCKLPQQKTPKVKWFSRSCKLIIVINYVNLIALSRTCIQDDNSIKYLFMMKKYLLLPVEIMCPCIA